MCTSLTHSTKRIMTLDDDAWTTTTTTITTTPQCRTKRRRRALLSAVRDIVLRDSPHITDKGLVCLALLSPIKTPAFSEKDVPHHAHQHHDDCRKSSTMSSPSSSLRTLTFYEAKRITDVGMYSLCTAFPKLESFGLLDSWPFMLTDSSLEYLSWLPELHYLSLRGACGVAGDGFAFIGQHLPKLESLDLESCLQLTDAHLVHIAKLSRLRSLDLWNCWRVTDHGLDILAQGLAPYRCLELLNLRNCTLITDDGLRHVAKLTELKELDLGDCCVTASGIDHLATLLRLEGLYFGGNDNVTLEMVRAVLPHLERRESEI